MKKMSTLFEINYENGRKGKITTDIRAENMWVYTDKINVKPTRKFDGSACIIIGGELYKRLDCKIDDSGKYKKPIPHGAITCGMPDRTTGHHPHWVKCKRTIPADKYFFEGFDSLDIKSDKSYELCGPKVNGNNEHLKSHELIPHGEEVLKLTDFSFDGIESFLCNPDNDIEGIVFWHKDGRMCKIRKADFGIRRP